MTRKTLHDIIRKPTREIVGSIPHVFHRHGPVRHHRKTHYQLPSGDYVPAETEQEKATAYGILAAGNSMIPWKNEHTNAGPLLQYAMRSAISTRLMLETGGHEQAPVFPPGDIPASVYAAATNALAHFGTANSSAILKRAQKEIGKRGMPYQAKMLPKYIESMIEMAMEWDHAGLEWIYQQFHSLYGNETKPNPDMPEPPPKPKEDPMPWKSMLPAELPGKGDTRGSGADAVPWGPIDKIVKLDMFPWKHPNIRSKKSWKYSEFGVFKYPWRALPSSDYQCFSLQRRKYGGTVLIDFSGSMSISQEEVDAVLNAAPYAMIAGYGSHPAHCDSGRIVIMAEDAKKGFADHARSHIGNGNVIDGPALRWLAAQDGPRIWISDGAVTGVGDNQTPALTAEAAMIQHAAKITRINTLAELLEKIS